MTKAEIRIEIVLLGLLLYLVITLAELVNALGIFLAEFGFYQ
jgi:hypothetical protein